jgi:hypothetical protein
LRGDQDSGLQGGKRLRPAVVRRVEDLVYDAGARGGGGGEGGVAGVAAHHLDVLGYGRGTGAVHQPDALVSAAAQRLDQGQTDRAGTEDGAPGARAPVIGG